MNYPIKKLRKRCWPGNLLLLVFCFNLVACGGGISGTGDGGPIITVDNSEGISSSGDTNNEHDSTSASPVSSQLQIFPSTLHATIDNSIVTAATLNSRFTDLSVQSLSQQLGNQLIAVQRQSSETLQHLLALENSLLDPLLTCDTMLSCETLSTIVNGAITQDSATGSTQVVNYSGIRYSPQLAGYFDKQLTFTTNNNTTVLRWTADQQLVSLVTETNATRLYLFSDFAQSQTTLRREDKTSSAILQSVYRSTSTTTTIEADLHGDQQHYIRASYGNNAVTLYAIHPTDRTVDQIREGFNLNTNRYAIESCSTTNDNCEAWQTDSSSDSTADSLFNESLPMLGDFNQSLASDLAVTVPVTVNEFVVATGSDRLTPLPQTLVCGGQRVWSNVRNYCWQPLPLDSTVQIFEEIKNSGTTDYQLLPSASIQ